MTIALIGAAGTGGAASATSTTIIPGGSGWAVGTLVTIGLATNGGGGPITSISDNSTQAGAANSYTLRSVILQAGNQTIQVAWCILTRSLLATDTVTVNFATATRWAIREATFSGVQAISPIDQSVSGSGVGSPLNSGSTAALGFSGELAISYCGWTGGAVASGVADTSGYTMASSSSSGVTARVESIQSHKFNANTAGESDNHTFTSITRAGIDLMTFIPIQAALYVPRLPDQDATRTWDRALYSPPRSQAINLFSPTLPQNAMVALSQSPSKPYYKGSYSSVQGAADEPIPSDSTDWVAAVQSRGVQPYKGSPDVTVPVFANAAAAAPDSYVPGAQSRALLPLAVARSQTITAYVGATPDSWVAPVQSARPLLYAVARSFYVPVWNPATSTFSDWAPPALLSRLVKPYAPPTMQPVVAWGQSVITDAYAPFAVDRSGPAYAPLRSLVISAFDNNAPGGPVWIGGVQSRIVPFYGGFWSSVMGAADEAIPSDSSDWATVIASRAVALYRGSPDFNANVYTSAVAQVSSWTPGVIVSRAVTPYRAGSSYWTAWDDHACTTLLPDTPVLGPDGPMLFPDLCPQVELGFVVQGRVVPFYRGPSGMAIPVYDTTAQTFATWTPGVIQSRITGLRQVRSVVAAPGSSQIVIPDSFVPGAFQPAAARAPQRPSQLIAPWQTTVVPDAMAFVAQDPARGVSRALGSSVTSDFGAAAPAQGYVAVIRSAPTMRALVRQSITILPDTGFVVVTQPPSGGGGEWIIWEKPNFPANRRDAWPSFVPPYFRKPSRPIKRGY